MLIFTKSKLIQCSIDIKVLNLDKKLNKNISIENFDNLLSFYGLNQNSKIKFWNKFLFLFFCLGLLRILIINELDPVKHYQICLYAGDTTILFKSFRKFFNYVLILTHIMAIQINYLFNHSPNTLWFEIFKCLDGNLSPLSVGIKDKQILKRILILTKFIFKLHKFYIIGMTSIVGCLSITLLLKRILVNDHIQLIWILIWLPILIYKIYFLAGTNWTSYLCFNIICFYCLINAQYYNQYINYLKTESYFGWKRFYMKLKLKYLFKQQNQFAIRIQKYNKFWRKFYLIIKLFLIPVHLIYFQLILFGHLNFDLNLIYTFAGIFTTIFLFFSCSIVCLLDKQMKLHSKRLIKFQLNPYLKFDVNTKIKVK